MLKLCLGFLVDTLFHVKWNIFIHADVLVLVSEFIMVIGAVLLECFVLFRIY